MGKLNKIMYIFIFIILVLGSTYVYAISVDEMIDQYELDPKCISELSEDELKTWKEALTARKDDNTDVLGTSYNADIDRETRTITEMLTKIEEREREGNKDSVEDKSDEEIEEMKKYNLSQIYEYLEKSNPDDIENIPQEVIDAWDEKVEENGTEAARIRYQGLLDGKSLDEIERELQDYRDEQIGGSGGSADDVLYKKPAVADSGDSSQSLDDMMSDGDDFVQSATDTPIDTAQLQSVSSNLFNIFVEVGVALAVIVGLVIGIKYMYSSVDQKAEIKKLLVPYLVGCVVIFGALGIWKFVVTLLQNV